MASAYRPCHKNKYKYNFTHYWEINLTTSKYTKIHFIPKQLINIIPTPPITPTTKSTTNKCQKPNTNKPKVLNSQLKHKIHRPHSQYKYLPKNKFHHTYKPHLKYKLHPKQRPYIKLKPPLTPKQINNKIHTSNSVKNPIFLPHPRHFLHPSHKPHPIHINYSKYIYHLKHNPHHELGTYPNLINYLLHIHVRNIIPPPPTTTHPLKTKTIMAPTKIPPASKN